MHSGPVNSHQEVGQIWTWTVFIVKKIHNIIEYFDQYSYEIYTKNMLNQYILVSYKI